MGARSVVILLLRQDTAEHRNGRAHDVHRVAGSGQRLLCILHRSGQPVQALQLGLVAPELALIRQFSMNDQIGDFLEFGGGVDVKDVVATIVQVVTGLAHRAQCGIACDHAGQRDGFLQLERQRCFACGYLARVCGFFVGYFG